MNGLHGYQCNYLHLMTMRNYSMTMSSCIGCCTHFMMTLSYNLLCHRHRHLVRMSPYKFISILQNYLRILENGGLLLQTTQPIRMHLTTKMLPPSGEEGCSPNENTGFPDTTNTTCTRSN